MGDENDVNLRGRSRRSEQNQEVLQVLMIQLLLCNTGLEPPSVSMATTSQQLPVAVQECHIWARDVSAVLNWWRKKL